MTQYTEDGRKILEEEYGVERSAGDGLWVREFRRFSTANNAFRYIDSRTTRATRRVVRIVEVRTPVERE